MSFERGMNHDQARTLIHSAYISRDPVSAGVKFYTSTKELDRTFIALLIKREHGRSSHARISLDCVYTIKDVRRGKR